MKKVLIIDSYQSEAYAQMLQKAYGESAAVTPLFRNLRNEEIDRLVDRDMTLFDEIKRTEVSGETYDVLFISGMLLVDKLLNAEKMKNQYGTSNAKIVVFSTMASLLDVKGVDHAFDKNKLTFPRSTLPTFR